MSQSPLIGSFIRTKIAVEFDLNWVESQSPLIGSFIRTEIEKNIPIPDTAVAIPSNRVIHSNARWKPSVTRQIQVAIPSNRVIHSNTSFGEIEKMQDRMSQSPLIGSFIRTDPLSEWNITPVGSQSPLIGSFIRT